MPTVARPILHVPVVKGWMLFEHRGRWDRASRGTDRPLPPPIQSAAAGRQVWVAAVRRPGRRPVPEPERCFVATCAGERPFLEQIDRTQLLHRLPDVLDATADGRPTGLGVPLTEPLYLVCTDGVRNQPCARSGRPVARALSALVGPRTWETTHLGGCRLAVNLACLPSGVYYGGVQGADVPAVVRATEAGRIALPWYRGRTGVGIDVQMAEVEVRRLTGLDAIGAVRPGAVELDDDGTRRVQLDTDLGRYRVMLRPGQLAGPRFEITEVVHPSACG
jgi:hypothetical protein